MREINDCIHSINAIGKEEERKMKLKKILAATLTTSMLFSGIAFTGVGVTEVQAVNGESQTARIVGTNIANNDGIVAYSGEADATHTHDYLMDHDGNNENDDNRRWLSKVALKSGTTAVPNTSYIVYDLGENGPRSYEGIKLRFHNKAFATNYKIYTSNVNNYDNTQTKINPEREGWREIDTFERTNYDGNTRFPLDELEKQTGLDRYILFCFTDMNLKGGATVSNQISIREIEIYHQAITSITLPESKDMLVGDNTTLEVTIAPDNATYTDVVWSVETIGRENETAGDVVTVNAEGQVTAKRPGKARVTATAKDDATKTASCVVTVQESKGDLNLAIEEASKLQEEDYTANSWTPFKDALDGAKEVSGNIYATKEMIEDAFNALVEAQNSLERVYKVTVDGEEVGRGAYNTVITLTAPEAPAGQKFAGWVLDGKVVSKETSYSIVITGDLDFTAKFVAIEEEVIQEPAALLNEVIMKTVAPTKSKVTFVNQIVIPEGYKVAEAGFAYTKDASLNTLHGENGILNDSRIKKVATTSLNKNGQFSVVYTKVTKGSNIYSEVYARLITPTGESVWVYSPLTHTVIK